MGRLLAFTGRLLFAFIFLSSGIQKLQSYDVVTGGPTMIYMEPKMDVAIAKVEAWAGTKLPVTKAMYPYALLAAIVLELGGGLLFVLNASLGAWMLLAFLLSVTPVMHAFWDATPNSQEQMADMIGFFKNLSMTGALLFYLGMRGQQR